MSDVALLDLTTEIDAAWIGSVLTPAHPGAVVRGVSLRPIGAGNVSDTVLVTVDYAERPDDAPDAVVAKFRPSVPEIHAHGLGSGAYHREIGAYRAITDRDACRIPRLLHVAGDETNINLVVEDLTSATAGDQVAGCGVGEAEAVLTQPARLHATFFPADEDTAPAWPIRMSEVADYWTGLTRTGSARALARYRDTLPAADLELVAAVADVVHDWHLLPQARLTLSHGDPRVDNILFEQAGDGVRAVLIDWQVTGLRNPMYDVGYFLSGSVPVAERRARAAPAGALRARVRRRGRRLRPRHRDRGLPHPGAVRPGDHDRGDRRAAGQRRREPADPGAAGAQLCRRARLGRDRGDPSPDVRRRSRVMPAPLPELGFYTLGGHVESPRQMLDELRLAEDLGFGTAFLSERFNLKEAASLTGAAGAVTERMTIATGATNHNTRHPAVTAAWATTVHRLTGGRFVLGLGRGLRPQLDAFGLPPVTTAQLEDFIGLMRRLWRGETVRDHDGPAGRYPALRLDPTFDEDIPIGLTAFGPNTLDLAGRAADVVVLHTYFSDETTARCVRRVRDAAERAGRDPASVAVWACLATVPDTLTEDVRLRRTVARLATYLQVYGDLMVRTNGWDPAALARFRADPVVAGLAGWADAVATAEQIEHIATVLPDSWLAAAATGSPDACARTVAGQFGLGVDGVITHCATPSELAPVLDAYRRAAVAGRAS